MKVKELEYNSSYIITSWHLDNILQNFKAYKLPQLNIYYDDTVDVIEETNDNDTVVLIGYCFDIRNSSLTTSDVLNNLLKVENLEEELDYINGRYNLIFNKAGNYRIYSDASQLRPLVYHKDSKTLASHDSLLNEVLNEYNISLDRRTPGFHTELDFTRFKDMYKFNPSLYLDYENFEFVRFYPRNQLSDTSVQEVFNILDPYFKNSSKYLENLDSDKFVTVTAGIDSRVSAALTRDFSNEIEYLTYTQSSKKLATRMAKKIYKIDEKITSSMKAYLGWNHNIIKLSNYTPSKEQINELNKIYNSKHAYALANYYRNEKKYNKAIHIKSTVFGMGKADFSRELDNHKDTFNFYKKCVHGLPKRFIENENVDKELNEYFERNLVTEGFTKGRHYFDIFHLESRMGNWHSMLTLETDPETEEFIFTNCRKIIDLIQAPSIKERRNYSLYKKIIEKYWPVLLRFGINTVKEDKAESEEDKSNEDDRVVTYNGLSIRPVNKAEIIDSKGFVHVKPETDLVNIYDTYSFAIEKSENKQLVTLTSFYRNKKAKNKINVIIKNDDKILVYDILDLNRGITIEIKDKPAIVSLEYNANFTSSSWVDAGEIRVEENKK